LNDTRELADAAIAQLDAEIRASSFSMKSLAAAIGIDYLTFRRYLKGHRPMPTPILIMALVQLGVPAHTFFDRAAARLDSEAAPKSGRVEESPAQPARGRAGSPSGGFDAADRRSALPAECVRQGSL